MLAASRARPTICQLYFIIGGRMRATKSTVSFRLKYLSMLGARFTETRFECKWCHYRSTFLISANYLSLLFLEALVLTVHPRRNNVQLLLLVKVLIMVSSSQCLLRGVLKEIIYIFSFIKIYDTNYRLCNMRLTQFTVSKLTKARILVTIVCR